MQKIGDVLDVLNSAIKKDWLKDVGIIRFKALDAVYDDKVKFWYVEFQLTDPLFINSESSLWDGAFITMSETWVLNGDKTSKELIRRDRYQYLLHMPKVKWSYKIEDNHEQDDLDFVIRYEDHGTWLKDHYPKYHVHVIHKDPRYEMMQHIEVQDFLIWIEKEPMARPKLLDFKLTN